MYKVACSVTMLVAVAVLASGDQQAPSLTLDEATAAQLQEAMASGRSTARQIAEAYLRRIDEIDRQGPALRSVIEINPDALTIADQLDAERKTKGPRGPLHGIPILIKIGRASCRERV